jgi:hypothetical protein
VNVIADNADQLSTVTLRVNGVDTALTVSISASGGARVVSDTTHSVAVSAGDKISWKNVSTTTSGTCSANSITAKFTL